VTESQNNTSRSHGIFRELSRRNVVRVAAAYLVFSWVLLQVVELVTPLLALPENAGRIALGILAVGLIPTLVFSWYFQVTPDGLKRESDLSPAESGASKKSRKLEYATLAGAVVLVVMILMRLQSAPEIVSTGEITGVEKPFEPPAHSIAVLPFTNMSGNPDNEYFSDGLSDTVLHRLAQVEQLLVIARTSSFQFRGTDNDIRSIGRKLNVGAVLEGSVQQMGDQMRIIAQLIDARDGTHLWSETFDASTENLFTVQDEISLRVAAALEIELMSEVTELLTASGTNNAEAHDLYTRGVYHADKFTPESVRLAHDYFSQAVEIDPGFVNAWVGMADSLLRSPEFEHVPGTSMVEAINAFVQRSFPEMDNEQRYQKARMALDTALSLDDKSATAWAHLGNLETWLGDRKAAEAAFKNAIDYQADLAVAHYRYAKFLADEYRYGKATEHFEAALKLDPVNIPVIYWTFWYVRLQENGFERAEQLINRLVEQDPEYEFRNFRRPSMYYTIYLFYQENGMVDKAVEWLEKELTFVPDRNVNIMQIAYCYATLGDFETALRWRDHARLIPGIYDDRNAWLLDWLTSLLLEPGEAVDLLNTVFGDSDDALILSLRALSFLTMGQMERALESFDRIQSSELEQALFNHETLSSNFGVFAPYYSALLFAAGRDAEATQYLEQIESLLARLKEQGWASSNLDTMEAFTEILRGDADKTLAALERAMEKGVINENIPAHAYFAGLHDYPRFHKLVNRFNARNAEQMKLLKERHRIPPPWSPDYQADTPD
jgi:TolB-like protein/tetratricopeptide (TPR) repeat protein